MPNIQVCAMYQFVSLPDYAALRTPLHQKMSELNVRGTLLLAEEGINGTIAGLPDDVKALLAWLEQDKRFDGIGTKISYTNEMPFKRCKVKLKKEIVTMGVAGIDPNHTVGTYLDAQQWNDLLDDPELLLIDCRNDYEFQVGSFDTAVNPNTTNFREFPAYLEKTLVGDKQQKIAMFCTGGIRCEKSTAYLKEQGYENVFHLKGGVLQYLEDMDEAQTKWQGECFVFDERVTVNHQLERGQYDQCHACRMPITKQDKLSEHFTQGTSCPHCFDQHTKAQKSAFAEREKQMQLAKKRGNAHMGAEAAEHLMAVKKKPEEYAPLKGAE
ncbi:MAG: rhodanese-related sulfurtransferase [Arenicellales bacterium]